MHFADIHTHILWGVDDGAKNQTQAHAMLDASYADGVRLLCLTPHYRPGAYREYQENAQKAFLELIEYALSKYPDLQLHLSNELHYHSNCISWLDEGHCRTMGGQHVLVDFSSQADSKKICNALYCLLNAGYVPILAHVERYAQIRGDISRIQQLRKDGILVQITAGAIFGSFGLGTKLAVRKLLREDAVDIVASDAHDLAKRKPGLRKASEYIAKKYGNQKAEVLCFGNASRILMPMIEEKEG